MTVVIGILTLIGLAVMGGGIAWMFARGVRDGLTVRRTNLEDERRRLLQAHYAGAVPLELLKEEQERLGRELAGIQRQLDAYQADAKLVRAHVEQSLDLLEDCYLLYMAAPDHMRKQLNQVFFERVLVNPAVDEEGRSSCLVSVVMTGLAESFRIRTITV